ncbi:MAG: tetratricopeptide repeat protein, partial [Acidobacteriaceae bacterium]
MVTPRIDNAESVKTLVSWKEIAVFLNRSESTVKRWERDRGLPVHRIPGGERGGVFAYADELSDWLKGKALELESEDLGAADQEPAGAEQGGASEGKVEPGPAEVPSRNRRRSDSLRFRLGVAGIAAAFAGTAIYASFAFGWGSWIERHMPAIAHMGPASSSRQVVTPVSDADRSAAHDLYLKGRFEWSQRTPDSLNRALDDFTQAIVHDPNDARAYAGLADSYEMLFIYGTRLDDDARDKAMAAAQKSLGLDSSLPEAHRALGYAMWRALNFPGAEKELNLAIQLDPKDPLAHLWLANVLSSHAKYAECLAEIDKAQELDPASASILAMKGETLYLTGKKEEGIALLNAAVRSEPNLGITHLYLAMIAYDAHNYPAYLRESQATADSRDDAWLKDVTAKLSAVYAREGERGLLRAEFAVQESCAPPLYSWRVLSRTFKAMDCLKLGRPTEALQLLEEASAHQEKDFEDFRTAYNSGSSQSRHRAAAQLANDPRFEALMAE